MSLNSNIIQINNPTPLDICQSVAGRVKQRRLELNFTQKGLSDRAGVNIETYRKFERTGEISLLNLARLAFVFNSSGDFYRLFAQKQYESLDHLINVETIQRKRGKRT